MKVIKGRKRKENLKTDDVLDFIRKMDTGFATKAQLRSRFKRVGVNGKMRGLVTNKLVDTEMRDLPDDRNHTRPQRIYWII